MSGGSSGGGLSKLGVALTVILLLTLIALMVQLIYVLWRRRVVCHRSGETDSTGDGIGAEDRIRMYSSPESPFSSRELLYFFCIKSKSGTNSKSVTVSAAHADNAESNRQLEAEVVEIDVLALNGITGVFGPPRFLFTIKEEEREGWESPVEKPVVSGETETNSPRKCKLSLKEYLKFAEETVIEVDLDGGESEGMTPFSTPCLSPLYFTPSASPIHEILDRDDSNA